MKKKIIAGVDTDIGKAFSSLGLAISQSKFQKTEYYKPFQYYEKRKFKAPDIIEM